MRKMFCLLALCAGVSLTACSALPAGLQNIGGQKKEAVQEAAEPSGSEETKEKMPETEQTPETEESTEDIDLNTALFRSTASTAQMEITTGLTTEYLANLCIFPLRVVHGEEETAVKDEKALDEMGLEPLYTDELLKAVGDFDTDNLEIEDDIAIVGDLDTAYIVLGKDSYGYIGITEFHYAE